MVGQFPVSVRFSKTPSSGGKTVSSTFALDLVGFQANAMLAWIGMRAPGYCPLALLVGDGAALVVHHRSSGQPTEGEGLLASGDASPAVLPSRVAPR